MKKGRKTARSASSRDWYSYGSQFHLFPRLLHDNASKRTSIASADIEWRLHPISTELSTSDRETRNAVGFESRVPVTIRTISFQRSETSRNNVIVIRHRTKPLDPHPKNFSNEQHFVSFRRLNTKLNYSRLERDGKLRGNGDIKIRMSFLYYDIFTQCDRILYKYNLKNN